jgi:hypothetical protein
MKLDLLVALLAIALAAPACGVRQFSGKVKPPGNTLGGGNQGFGPFYSAGQGGGSMSAPACASGSGHHPCARARASVGMPYQFDTNANAIQGPITTGSAFGAPAPYAGTPGAGAGKVASAPLQPSNHGPDTPRAENRDLHVIERQPSNQQNLVF